MVTPVTDQEQRVGFSTTTSLESAGFIIFEREAALRGLWYGRLVEDVLMDNVSAFTVKNTRCAPEQLPRLY